MWRHSFCLSSAATRVSAESQLLPSWLCPSGRPSSQRESGAALRVKSAAASRSPLSVHAVKCRPATQHGERTAAGLLAPDGPGAASRPRKRCRSRETRKCAELTRTWRARARPHRARTQRPARTAARRRHQSSGDPLPASLQSQSGQVTGRREVRGRRPAAIVVCMPAAATRRLVDGRMCRGRWSVGPHIGGR
eukprot:350700-Chlamydomonas_euryale.AAC.7